MDRQITKKVKDVGVQDSHEREPLKENEREAMVSMWYKHSVISIEMDFEGKFVPLIRLPAEPEERLVPDAIMGFDTIARAVTSARREIDKLLG